MVSTSGKAALGGNRPGAHVLRNFYYSADPNTGRGRSAAGRRAYRERERDSDSERRNVTRRACFAVVVGRAAMPQPPLLDLLEPSREQSARARARKRQAAVTTPSDDPQETRRVPLADYNNIKDSQKKKKKEKVYYSSIAVDVESIESARNAGLTFLYNDAWRINEPFTFSGRF